MNTKNFLMSKGTVNKSEDVEQIGENIMQPISKEPAYIICKELFEINEKNVIQ